MTDSLMTERAIHPFQRSPGVSHSGGFAFARRLDQTSRSEISNGTHRAPGPANSRQESHLSLAPAPVAEEPATSAPPTLDRLLIRKGRRMLLVRTDEIQLILAAGNYVRIITADASHLLRSPLAEMMPVLDPARFLRIHRSAIINTEFLESVETNPAGDYFLQMPQGQRLKCSRSYRGGLRLFLRGLAG